MTDLVSTLHLSARVRKHNLVRPMTPSDLS